jgi:hypothetical protein
VDLLEREGELAILAETHAEAARGDGRVVVTGEPRIGKTSLVARFLTDLEPGARVLLEGVPDVASERKIVAPSSVQARFIPSRSRMAVTIHVTSDVMIAGAEARSGPRPAR